MAKDKKQNKQTGNAGAPKLYEASIAHDKDTISDLYTTAHRTYHQSRIMTRMGVGMGLVLLAVMASIPNVVKILCIAIGCWLIVGGNFGSINRAEDAIEKRGGSLPVMRYRFYAHDMLLSGEGEMRLKYSSFEKLIEDEKYLYMFQSENSICMIDKRTINPKGTDEFKEFIEGKTKLKWKKNKSIFSMSLSDFLEARKRW